MNKDLCERYMGHLSIDLIGEEGQRRINESRVLIVGAGGLGSPVTLYLAAAGVGNLCIVDPDTVSLSNLQRQIIHSTADIDRPKAESACESAIAVNPNIRVIARQEYLTPENASALFADYDIVVDCTDNFSTRILISDTCVALGKPYVYGSVSRFTGQLFTFVPGSADYRTYFGDDNPGTDFPCSVRGILNTLVGIVGTIQATEVLKYITGCGTLLTDRLLTLDALTMTFREFPI